MKNPPKVRNAILVAAIATVTLTATAWATSETVTSSSWVPYSKPMVEATTISVPAEPVVVKEPIAPSETLAPNETVVTQTETTTVHTAPREHVAVPRSELQPAITIEERRLSLDQRIQLTVMDRLASAPNLSGKIGVESNDAVVTLTGYTVTAGQAWRAERVARSVDGVRYVQNQIRPRIGGSV